MVRGVPGEHAVAGLPTYTGALLEDVEEILDGHKRLRTGKKGRQWGLGALNRAAIVMAVSAWEAYVEDLVEVCILELKPSHQVPFGSWPALKANAGTLVGRFHNPGTAKVRELFRDAIGLPDVMSTWAWRNCSREVAMQRLDAPVAKRHEIAHGASPRPVVHNTYARAVSGFLRRLARRTDVATGAYLPTCGVRVNW